MLGRGVEVLQGEAGATHARCMALPAVCGAAIYVGLPVAMEGLAPGGGAMPADGWRGMWSMVMNGHHSP